MDPDIPQLSPAPSVQAPPDIPVLGQRTPGNSVVANAYQHAFDEGTMAQPSQPGQPNPLYATNQLPRGQTQQVLTGADSGATEYARWQADILQHNLEQQSPELGDQIPKIRQEFEKNVRDRARTYQLQKLAQQYPNAGDPFSNEWTASRIPGLNIIRGIEDASTYKKAADAFESGKATIDDYRTLAQGLALQQNEAHRSFGRKVFDSTTRLLSVAAEFGATGGLTEGVGAGAEALTSRALGSAAEGVAGRLAVGGVGAAARGAAFTAAAPSFAGEAVQQAAPQLTFDQQGNIQTAPGKGGVAATRDAFLGNWLDNTVFMGTGALAPHAGRSMLRNVFTGLAAGAGAQELKGLVGLAPQGGVVRSYLSATNDQQRMAAVQNLAVEAASFGLLEGILNAPRTTDLKGIPETLTGKEFLERLAYHEAYRDSLHPTTPGQQPEPAPPQGWAGMQPFGSPAARPGYTDQPETSPPGSPEPPPGFTDFPERPPEPPGAPLGPPTPPGGPEVTPEAPTQPAAPPEPPQQTWQHTGTEFSGPNKNEFVAKDGKKYTVKVTKNPATESQGAWTGLSVVDEEGKRQAEVDLIPNPDGKTVHDESLRSKKEGIGLARAMYDYMAGKGSTIVPSELKLKEGGGWGLGLSEEGAAFWKANAAGKKPEPPQQPPLLAQRMADVQREQQAGRWPEGELKHEAMDPHQLVNIEGLTPETASEKMDAGQTDLPALIDALKQGQQVPPVVVSRLGKRLQVLDGEHTATAAAFAGVPVHAVVIERSTRPQQPPEPPKTAPEAPEETEIQKYRRLIRKYGRDPAYVEQAVAKATNPDGTPVSDAADWNAYAKRTGHPIGRRGGVEMNYARTLADEIGKERERPEPVEPTGKMPAEELKRRLLSGEDIPGLTALNRADLLQHILEGTPQPEIGEQRGVTRAAVSASVKKALGKLAETVDPTRPESLAPVPTIPEFDQLSSRVRGERNPHNHEWALWQIHDLMTKEEGEAKAQGKEWPAERQAELLALANRIYDEQRDKPDSRSSIRAAIKTLNEAAAGGADQPSPVRRGGTRVQPGQGPGTAPSGEVPEGGGGRGEGASTSGEAGGDELAKRMTNAFEKHFDNQSSDPEDAGTVLHGRTLRATLTQEDVQGKTVPVVHILFSNADDFSTLERSVGKELRPGTLDFARRLAGFVREVGEQGLRVSYQTSPKRFGAYEKPLLRAGYTLEQGWTPADGEPGPVENFVWKPPSADELPAVKEIDDATTAALQSGHAPQAVAEVVQRAQAAGEAEAREEAGGTTAGPSGAPPGQPGSAARSEQFGPAGRSVPLGRHIYELAERFARDEGGYLNVSQLMQKTQEAAERLTNAWHTLKDEYDKFAQAHFPALFRTDAESGSKAAALSGSKATAYYGAEHSKSRLGDLDDTTAARVGATMREERNRYAKQQFIKESTQSSNAAFDYRQRAAATVDPKEKARLLAAAAQESKRATEMHTAANDVSSMVGLPEVPDEAAYQASLRDQTYQQARKGYMGFHVDAKEDLFRRAQGLDPADPIEALTQIQGMPISAYLKEEDVSAQNVGGGRGNLKNPKAKRLGTAQAAGLDADPGAYETDIRKIIDMDFQKGQRLANLADFYRTMVANKQAVFNKPGQKITIDGEAAREIPNVTPPKGTQAASAGPSLPANVAGPLPQGEGPMAGPGQTSLYVRESIHDEVRDALRTDRPDQIPVISDFNKILYRTGMASSIEATAHTKGLLTHLTTEAAMNPLRFIKNGWAAYQKTPEVLQKMWELAKIDATRPPDLFGTPLGPDSPYNPLTWSKNFLHWLDMTTRLTADQAFTSLTKRADWAGRVEDTPENRAQFINQAAGNYGNAQPKLIQLLRDTGFGPFAVASARGAMGGIRALTGDPGVRAATPAGRIALRAERMGRIAAVVGAAAVWNLVMHGRADGDDNTPLGALKLSSAGGKTSYINLTDMLTPLPRGLRETGLMATLEGAREGRSMPKIADKAVSDVVDGMMHFAGPPVQFGIMAATGKNAAGYPTAEKAGPGESQAVQNIKGAALNLNPSIGALTGANRPGQQSDFSDRLSELGGPFQIKGRVNRDLVNDFYDALHASEAQKQQVQRSGQAFTGDQARQYRQLHQVETQMTAINKALRSAPSPERAAQLRARALQLAQKALQR